MNCASFEVLQLSFYLVVAYNASSNVSATVLRVILASSVLRLFETVATHQLPTAKQEAQVRYSADETTAAANPHVHPSRRVFS